MTGKAPKACASEISLRTVQDSDLDILFQFQLAPRANQMAAFTAADPADRDAFDAHWSKILADTAITIRIIEYHGQAVGHIAAFLRDGLPEVTYWIGEAFWGNGIATVALRALLDIYQARPLYARAVADNAGSIRVLEKCGFVLETRERGFANARGKEVAEVVMVLRQATV